MKKIIFAALSVLMMLILVGCGEHLVDFKVIDLSSGAVPGDWAIPANWDNTTPFTSVDKDNNTYTFEFTVKDDLAAGAEVGFKILTKNGEWNVDGYTEFNVDVDGASVDVPLKLAADMGGAGNAFVKGCEAGKTYKMTIVCNSDSSATVKVESMADPVYPVPYVLSGMFIHGGMFDASWGAVLDGALLEFETSITDGVVVYKKDFIASSDDENFKIASADWNNGWAGTEFTLDAADYVEFKEQRVDGKATVIATGEPVLENGKEKGDTNNAVLKGTKVGKTYRLYIKTTPDKKVFAKVVTLTPVTVSGATVTATGLPEALNGKTLYFTGDFNNWKTPGADGSISAAVSDGEITITLPDFSKDFEGSEPQEFAVAGKFASGDGSNWARPEIGVKEGNIEFTVTAEKKALIGTFVEKTPHKDGGDIYVCNWVVE